MKKNWQRAVATVLVATLCGAGLAATSGLADEPRVLRVVGVQALDASAAKAGGPRQGAINAALFEAVSRVAHELVDEYGPPVQAGGDDGATSSDGTLQVPGALDDGWVRNALGKDMTPFARSFRLVDDKGSRPVLFKGETDATHEYVVVIEATVDVDKVRDRLASKGIIALEEEDTSDDGIEIEALGLRHWSAYEAFVAMLEGPRVRASEVRPLEFEAGRALVYAVVRGAPEDVLGRVVDAAPPGMQILESDLDDDGDGGVARIRLKVIWTPPASG